MIVSSLLLADNQKISELTAVTQLDKDDILLVSEDNGDGTFTSKKVKIATVRENFNVRDYGATGDGVADDTAAIQAAIAACDAAGGGTVLIPSRCATTSTITIPSYVEVVGSGMYASGIVFSGTGYAVHFNGSYAGIRDCIISVADGTGGISIGAADSTAQTSKNHIVRCLIQGTPTIQTTLGTAGVYIVGNTATYPAYFNTIDSCVIRRFYDGIDLGEQGNANFLSSNTIEYYHKYGVNFNGGDENMIYGGFFQQAAGRSDGDLTYAVNIISTSIANLCIYSAEPGVYSSSLYINSNNNQCILNCNSPYGIYGSAKDTASIWTTNGYLHTTKEAILNGGLSVKNGSTSAGFVDLYEDSDNGTNKVMLQAPAALSANVTATWPETTGTVGVWLSGSATWDPASLADGAGETSAGITVTGAALGDFVVVSAPYDLQDCVATAYVQTANTVEIRLQNESTGTRDLASGTWRVRVMKQ